MRLRIKALIVAGSALVAGAAWSVGPDGGLAKVLAQTQSVASAFAVPVETMKLGGAKAGLFETGSSAAGRQILVRTSTSSSQVFGKTRTRLTNAFRFMKGQTEVTLAGDCTIRTEGRSMLNINFTQNKARAYSCVFQNQPESQYALEVALPAFAETRAGGNFVSMTISRNEPDAAVQAILKAKLVYGGVEYEATPTGFGPDRPGARRVVQGYNISRDGKLLGRLAYRQTGVTSLNDQGDITIPSAEADGRDAVLFLIMSLNAMPDVFASRVREEISWQ